MIIKLVALVVTLVVSRLQCLSLDEIHSSSQTFKSLSHNTRDKTPKTAFESIRNRRQEHRYGSHSLPLHDYYYRRVMAAKTRPNYQSVGAILVYNPNDSENFDESQANDLLSTELGVRLAEMLGSDSDVGHRIYNRINRKRKRSASNRNYYTQTVEAKAKPTKPNKPTKTKVGHTVKHVHPDHTGAAGAGGAGRGSPANPVSRGARGRTHSTLNKPKVSSMKSLVKRKSSRRVLNDHFNVEENNPNVINKSNYLKPFTSLTIPLRLKSKLSKNIENKLKREAKKSIKKRREVREESAMAIEESLESDPNKTNEMRREMKTTDKTVVSELNDILSDDSKSDNKVEAKSSEKITSISTTGHKNNTESDVKQSKEKAEKVLIEDKGHTIKRKSKRSDSDVERLIPNDFDDTNSAIIYQKIDGIDGTDESSVATDWPQSKQEMNDWLQKEFYENIAKTLATMRKKRSDDNEDIDDMNRIEAIGDNLIAIDESNEEEDNANENQFKTLETFPDDSDNDYVVAAIDDDKEPNLANNDDDDSDDTEEEEAEPKMKRSADSYSYFGDLDDSYQSNPVNIDSERFNQISTKFESIEDSLINEAMDLIRENAAKASERDAQNSQMIAHRLDAAYDIEDMRTALEDLGNNFYKISQENRENEENNEIDYK